MKKNEKKAIDKLLSSKKLDHMLLDNSDVARLLKVSPRTIYNMRKKNILKYCKLGGKYYYPIKYIKRMMKIINGELI